ncbi:hypothetical protein [Dermatobacter hominis]|uniref:hypothetical protein n=1 Tax=Dermatobacter hominis TaxID=2884263 RepID=UPI001D0FCD96|nr:hypothetical protein [Dermatobacter hominis]UDY37968.1 hypothetical protein LH044_10585 [Dermatobacter hominis]
MATTIEVHPAGPARPRRSGFVGPQAARAPGARRQRLIWLAVAAALAGSGLVVMDRIAADRPAETAGPPTGTAVATMPAADFRPRADDVCTTYARSIATIGFRPNSMMSDIADARSRIDALDQAIAVLVTLPPPTDDPALTGTVVRDLHGARATAESVLTAPSASTADARWARVDPTVAVAFGPLAEHGASRCRF